MFLCSNFSYKHIFMLFYSLSYNVSLMKKTASCASPNTRGTAAYLRRTKAFINRAIASYLSKK